jgi:hypothetical protein
MRIFVENYVIRFFSLTGPDHNLNDDLKGLSHEMDLAFDDM